MAPGSDGPFHDTVKEVPLSAQDKGDGSAEAGRARGVWRTLAVGAGHGGLLFTAGHLREELVHIGLRVPRRTGITGRLDAGCAAQDVYFQTGIVGKAIQSRFFVNIIGFLEGIGPQGVSGFGDVFGNTYFCGGNELKALAKDFFGLLEFSRVARCKYKFTHTYKN